MGKGLEVSGEGQHVIAGVANLCREVPDVIVEVSDPSDEVPNVINEASDLSEEGPDIIDEVAGVSAEVPDIIAEVSDLSSETRKIVLLDPEKQTGCRSIPFLFWQSRPDLGSDLCAFLQTALTGCRLSRRGNPDPDLRALRRC